MPRTQGGKKTAKPTAKVTAGGAAGSLTVVAVFIAERLGLDVPPEVASAVTVLVGTAAAYFRPNSYGKG